MKMNSQTKNEQLEEKQQRSSILPPPYKFADKYNYHHQSKNYRNVDMNHYDDDNKNNNNNNNIINNKNSSDSRNQEKNKKNTHNYVREKKTVVTNISDGEGKSQIKHSCEEDFDFEVVRGADGNLYRRSAQAFFVNEHGEFLAFTPVGNPQYLQTVQGGVCKGEDPLHAALRETWEEAGIDAERDAALISVILPITKVQTSSSSSSSLSESSLTTTLASLSGNDTSKCCDNSQNDCKKSGFSNDGQEKMFHQNSNTRNANDEILDETRKEFRYANKTWRKRGIKGQELYPFLFITKYEIIYRICLQPRERNIRQEFARVCWVPLEDIVSHTPPSKVTALCNICKALYCLLRSVFASPTSALRPSMRMYSCSLRSLTSSTKAVLFPDEISTTPLNVTRFTPLKQHQQQ